MQRSDLITYLPKDVVYHDGSTATLSLDYVLTEGNLRLYVPPGKMEDVVGALRNAGFKDAILRIPKGERYSLSLRLGDAWELHVRIYEDGFIDCHFEVSREYLEHLTHRSVPCIYEVFMLYRTVYDKLYVFDNAAKKWIVRIESNYKIRLPPPSTSTEWKPIVVMGLTMVALILLLNYALSRPEREKDQAI